MDVLVYKIDGLATLTISTKGKVAELRADYVRRFDGELHVEYRVSHPGTLTLFDEAVKDEGGIVDGRTGLPVIFETPNYFFDVSFDRDAGIKPDSMYVRHHLEDVAGRFYAREWSLTGQLSFVNEPGKFRFEVAYERGSGVQSFWIEFLVVSTKLNVQADYREILSRIEHEDRNMVFSSYAKTINDVTVKKRAQAAGDWSWAVYFGRAFDEYEDALKRILRLPHKEMVSRHDYRRADQIWKWNVPMVRSFARLQNDLPRLETHRFRNPITENTFDTSANRFVKYTLGKMGLWLSKAVQAVRDDSRYAEKFRQALAERAERFAQYLHAPMLKSVGRYVEPKGGDLVLQMRPGYVQIRIVWELMHALFTTDANLSRRKLSVGFNSLAALYEFWCFIEMREIVHGLLGANTYECRTDNREGLSIAKVLEGALENESVKGVRAYGCQYLKDGQRVVAELMFQQSYGPNEQEEACYAKPFCQRPDIVLRLFQDGRPYTYLFDAKYQLECSPFTDSKDAAPRAALDQMHRYRDAILYRERGVSRDVVGAFILFPGDEAREANLYDYEELVEEQNIGAFPLLPKKHQRLKAFLTRLFARVSFGESSYAAWLEAEAIPQRYLRYVEAEVKILKPGSLLVAKGYPKGFVEAVKMGGWCPWILPSGMSAKDIRLVLCGSVNGVDKIALDEDVPPKGSFSKAELFEADPEFSALEPRPGGRGRAFPLGDYFVWKVKEICREG